MKKGKEVVYLLILVGLFTYIIFIKKTKPSQTSSGINLHLKTPIQVYSPRSDSLVIPRGFSAEYTLLMYFTARDCYSCLQEYEMWNQLIEDYPPEKFRMIGIYPYTEETEIFSLAFADSIDFPLYKDPGNIRDLLQIHQTPTKILIGPYNQIRYIDGPHQQRHYQKQFYTAVRNIVGLPINRTF